MSYNWREYLDLAKGLLGKNKIDTTCEACKRTSISRSFYAAYNTIYNYFHIKTRGNMPKGYDAYKYIEDELDNSSNENEREISRNLKRIKTYRIQADYYDLIFTRRNVFGKLSSKAELSLIIAENIISKIENIIN